MEQKKKIIRTHLQVISIYFLFLKHIFKILKFYEKIIIE